MLSCKYVQISGDCKKGKIISPFTAVQKSILLSLMKSNINHLIYVLQCNKIYASMKRRKRS